MTNNSKKLVKLVTASVFSAFVLGSASVAVANGEVTYNANTDVAAPVVIDGTAIGGTKYFGVNAKSSAAENIDVNLTKGADITVTAADNDNTVAYGINANNANVNISEGLTFKGITSKLNDFLVGLVAQGTGTIALADGDVNISLLYPDNIPVTARAIGISDGASVNITTAGNINISAKELSRMHKGTLNIGTDDSKSVVLKGDILFNSDKNLSFVNINLPNSASSWTGDVYDIKSCALGYIPRLTLKIGEGSTLNTSMFAAEAVESNGGIFNISNKTWWNSDFTSSTVEKGKVSIGTLTGTGALFNITDIEQKVTIGSNQAKKTVVAGNCNVADQMTDKVTGMQKLADTVAITDGNKVKTVTLAPGKVLGEMYTFTDENGRIGHIYEKENVVNRGMSEMAASLLMGWRAENNDMNKRLGELRNAQGQQGVWARMQRGKMSYGSQNVNSTQNTYQVGYDAVTETTDNGYWTMGLAYTQSNGRSGFNYGSSENKSKGLAVYGSYLAADGWFLDLIGKYSRLSQDYKLSTAAGNGDYSTNGFSLSAEYGKRFSLQDNTWIEPQAELTYGDVGSVSYRTANGVNVDQNSIKSLVGRVGFMLGTDFGDYIDTCGYNFSKGNAYFRASYLYDFNGDTNVTLTDGIYSRAYKNELGGGWGEVGVGTNMNIDKNSSVYLDVNKSFSGKTNTDWQYNIGYRFSF